MMTTHDLSLDDHEAAYEAAFDEIWQQTCLGRFSVAEVRERLLALKVRFPSGTAGGFTELHPQRALG